MSAILIPELFCHAEPPRSGVKHPVNELSICEDLDIFKTNAICWIRRKRISYTISNHFLDPSCLQQAGASLSPAEAGFRYKQA
jgi:hypothetical protein